MNTVETDRLKLVPLGEELLEALLNGSNEIFDTMGSKLNQEWPTNDTLDILSLCLNDLKNNPDSLGFGIWAIVKKDDSSIVGDIGFKGMPNDDGIIEMGYGIIPSQWGQGFATEAARGILGWAFSRDDVTLVKADCLPDNVASIKVLTRLNMQETGRDQHLIYWQISKTDFHQ